MRKSRKKPVEKVKEAPKVKIPQEPKIPFVVWFNQKTIPEWLRPAVAKFMEKQGLTIATKSDFDKAYLKF